MSECECPSLARVLAAANASMVASLCNNITDDEDEEQDDDEEVRSVPSHHVFMHYVAAVCLLLPSFCWLMVPYVSRQHWGDVAYYSYIRMMRLVSRFHSWLVTAARSRGLEEEEEEDGPPGGRLGLTSDSGMDLEIATASIDELVPQAMYPRRNNSTSGCRSESAARGVRAANGRRGSMEHRVPIEVQRRSIAAAAAASGRRRRRRRRGGGDDDASSESSSSSSSSSSSESSDGETSSSSDSYWTSMIHSFSASRDSLESGGRGGGRRGSRRDSLKQAARVYAEPIPIPPKLGQLKRGRKPNEPNDVLFASRRFYASETGKSAVLLVRRNTRRPADVTISTVETYLGARPGFHYIPLSRRPVHFAAGVASARVEIETVYHPNWDSALILRVVIDDDNGKKNRVRDKENDGEECLDWRCCTMHIINIDEFPRSQPFDKDLFSRETYWPFRILVFCRFLYDDLRLHIPRYFRPRFVLWYFAQFVFVAGYASFLLPGIYLRLLKTTIPEKRQSEAVALAAIGIFATCILQRIRYSFFGYWALGRFNSLRLVRYFTSIPFLHLQDPSLNGRFHKLFAQMEDCIRNTWHSTMLTLRLFVSTVVLLAASVVFRQGKRRVWLFPVGFTGIIGSLVLARHVQHVRGWPTPTSFYETEDRQTLINSELDNLINNRVIHSTLDVAHRSMRRIDAGYAKFLHDRNQTWYYLDHNYWSKYWAWAILVWLYVAMSPVLVATDVISLADFSVMLYLMILQGTVLSNLDDSIERFRYGLAQLDYFAETVCNEDYRDYRLKLVAASLAHNERWERDLAPIKRNPIATDERRRHVWSVIRFDKVSGTDLPVAWESTSSAKALAKEEDFVDCSGNIPLGGRIYGIDNDNDRFLNVEFIWLLSGHVLPKSGNVYPPPDFLATLVPAELDCMPVAGTLMENLRYGCGDEESSGVTDAEIAQLCRKLGMNADVIAANPIITRSSMRYSVTDTALMHLAQHILTFPDLLLVNNLHCVTPESVDALRLYTRGGLVPDVRRRTAIEAGAVPPDQPKSRTVIMRLPDRAYCVLVDREISISKGKVPTEIRIAHPPRYDEDDGRRHSLS